MTWVWLSVFSSMDIVVLPVPLIFVAAGGGVPALACADAIAAVTCFITSSKSSTLYVFALSSILMMRRRSHCTIIVFPLPSSCLVRVADMVVVLGGWSNLCPIIIFRIPGILTFVVV